MKLVLLCALLSAATSPAAEYLVTAYCPCAKCCGAWSRYGVTASGARPTGGVSLAGPTWFPFGTRLYLPGIGWRTVQDRMARRHRQSHRLDVFFPTHTEALNFGTRRLTLSRP